LGVDLHRTQFVVCTRWENGKQEIRQWRIGELPKFVDQYYGGTGRKNLPLIYTDDTDQEKSKTLPRRH
jgi:hypothetical protein